MPLAHNFLNYFWWNASSCNALRPVRMPQGKPAHAAPPALGLQHMPRLLEQPPYHLIQVLPRRPTQLRTLTQFPISAHSLESNPTCNLQLAGHVGDMAGEHPAWFQTHWWAFAWQEKCNPFSLWNAWTPSVHLLPRKLTCGFATKAGHAAKETDIILVSNTSKDFLWLAKVWTT